MRFRTRRTWLSRVLVLVALVVGVASSTQAAAPRTSAPTTARAAGFAVSARVRDLASKMPPDSTIPAEWIRDNDRLPRSKGPFYPGRGEAPAAPLAETPNAMPGPSGTFAAISADEAATVGGRFVPPDTVGDVGPNHFVQAVNTVLRVYDKDGNPLTDLVNLSTFFAPLGAGCGGQYGDPIVLYDSLADRWIVSQFGLPNGFQPPFHQCIAV